LVFEPDYEAWRESFQIAVKPDDAGRGQSPIPNDAVVSDVEQMARAPLPPHIVVSLDSRTILKRVLGRLEPLAKQYMPFSPMKWHETLILEWIGPCLFFLEPVLFLALPILWILKRWYGSQIPLAVEEMVFATTTGVGVILFYISRLAARKIRGCPVDRRK
jgi:hypothetical protein